MNFHEVLVSDWLESSDMRLRFDSIYSREVSQESLFGLVKCRFYIVLWNFRLDIKVVVFIWFLRIGQMQILYRLVKF
jgi:hypothetical protein